MNLTARRSARVNVWRGRTRCCARRSRCWWAAPTAAAQQDADRRTDFARGMADVSDRDQHPRGERAALRIAAGIFRSDARPAAQIFLLLLPAIPQYRSRRPRSALSPKPRSTRRWPTASVSSSSAAAGDRCRCGWRENIPPRAYVAVSNSHSQRAFITGSAEARRVAQRHGGRGRHQRI